MSLCLYTMLSVVLFLFSMAFIIPPSSSINLGFQAPLIHKNSPASPFYNPKAKRTDVIRTSVRSSLARSNYINSLLLGNSSSLFAIGPIIFENPFDYVMPYFIGTPPIKSFGFLDTGSDFVWLQCQPCKKCFDQTQQPIFNPHSSSTYDNVSCMDPYCFLIPDYGCFVDVIIGDTVEDGVCTYSVSYMDGTSSAGLLSTETITLPDNNSVTGNNTIKDMVFRCGLENVETDKGQHPSGIIGLANTSLSLVSQLQVTTFSYCVVANDTTNESHGWIRFGLAAVISGASTPLFPNKHGLHFIKFEGISLTGDWLLNISMEPFAVTEDGTTGFMIDSGTSITMLHANAYDVLLDSIRRYKGEGGLADHDKLFDLCFDDLLDAPEIEFHFKSGASIPLSNDSAWIENSVGVWCLAIERTHGVSILGMRQQRNMNIGYDYSVDQVAFTYAYTCLEDLF